MISWRIILVILGVMILLVTIQTFIVEAYLDRIGMMVVVLTLYLIFVCLVISGIIWLIWKHYIGKPLHAITKAARKVASGDFSIQIQHTENGRKVSEMDVLINDFNKMTRELAGNEMLKNDFIANVSHEIKTPISIIQSYAKALKRSHRNTCSRSYKYRR
jgi:signal transduction histidine kinase